MKARYVVIISFLSVVVNILSIYNFRFALVSLFFLLISFIPALYEKIYQRFSKMKMSERSPLAEIVNAYFSQGIVQTLNKVGMIFGLIIIYIMATGAIWLQMNDSSDTVAVISAHIDLGPLVASASALSTVGWGIFVLSLILITIHTIQFIRNASMFSENTSLK